MKLEKIGYSSLEYPSIPNPNLTLSLYIKDGVIYSYLQKNGKLPILKTNKKKIDFTLEDVNTMSKLILINHPTLFIDKNSQLIKVQSSPKKDYEQSLINIPYNINDAILEIEYYTTAEAKPFVILYGQPYSSSTIALHDQIPKSTELTTIQLSFKKLVEKPALVFRNWSKEGTFVITSYKILGNGYIHDSKFLTKTTQRDVYIKDKNRFIAHAGGKIKNRTYTNSLEALNNSYENGFRLFELDIIKTSDEKYVAAHDWNHWSKITNYSGVLPVSEKMFLKYKLYGEFTPMNMELINKWFKEHPDAILVTDKVNEPKEFTQSFMFKERLMMELFSIEAVEEALSLGIKSVMPSEKVVNSLGKDQVSALKSLGIEHVAVSRRFIAPNIQLIERMQNNDIKVYVYNVNADKGKDENYVVNYEMDYIYGLYADDWDFK